MMMPATGDPGVQTESRWKAAMWLAAHYQGTVGTEICHAACGFDWSMADDCLAKMRLAKLETHGQFQNVPKKNGARKGASGTAWLGSSLAGGEGA